MDLGGPNFGAWDRLAQENRNIFLTPDFAQAWWSAYRPHGRPIVLSDHPERPRCIVPLYRSGGSIPVVRQIGHGPADALGPLCAPSDMGLAADLVRSELRQELRRGVLVLHDAAVAGEWAHRLGGHVIRTTDGPTVGLGMGSWDAFLAARSKNFREQTRRKRARLHRSFEVTIRTSDSGTLAEDLSTLMRLHRLKWGPDAPFATGRQADLAKAFASRCMERDRLRLSVMELDGRPAAALLGLRFAGVHSFWQSGRDPGYEQHSVGSVLLMDALRAAIEDGASEYRLLRGDEAYKQRLADMDRGTCTVALADGVLGNAMIRAARTRLSVRRRLHATGGAALRVGARLTGREGPRWPGK